MSGLLVAGHASLFGIADLAGDIVCAGAFADSLARRPAKGLAMLLQHDPLRPAGTWLEAREDGVGLWVEGRLDPASPAGRDAADMIRRRGLDGLSIGFLPDSARPRPGGGRFLDRIDLHEVSLVTFPMLTRARIRVAA